MEKPGSLPENVHDLLRHGSSELDVFFAPSSVAVIGATETPGSVGRTVLTNLIATPFGGTVYPVNPKRPNVLGIHSHPSVGAVPAKLDLAVVVTPAPTVPGIVRECVEAGVRGCIVISAGFRETGEAGAELERQTLAEARRGRMRIIGPNCLGVMNPINGFNATFAASVARPGSVGFISQSGALLTAILDWSRRSMVGFSAFVSVGSMLDVGWGDLIDYLGDDPKTKSIVLYMETIGDARAFLSAAREVALSKPIIVIKPGRSAEAARAAASHTGSMAGSDDVLDAAFRRCGVLRVQQIADLFYLAESLDKQPRPRGPHLTMLTNAGGPGVLATDALTAMGGQLAALSRDTMGGLDEVLPAAWSHNNPVDVLGDAGPERYARALDICAKDPASDGLLVMLTPQAMTDPTRIAEALRPFAHLPGKPVLASWMGDESVAEGRNILREMRIPQFEYPDTACRTFAYMWRYSENLRLLYETPAPAAITGEGSAHVERAGALIRKVQARGRTLLTEKESKDLLETYGIPTVPTRPARSEAEAVKVARALGYPVVLKLSSETITHKTDVGGVKLNLDNDKAVRAAFRQIKAAVPGRDFGGVTVQPMVSRADGYELIVGASVDPQFGPVLLVGSGGQLVEVYRDRALALPPLNTTLARRLVEETKVSTALRGVRGRKAVDLRALEQLLVRFGYLVLDHPRIKEIDINPLLGSPEGWLALDARVVLHDSEVRDEALPRPAIRPYPNRYIRRARLRSGTRVTIRPILQQDEPLLVKFHQTLSEQSVYLRYFQMLKLDQRVMHERLLRRCCVDFQREIALVAEVNTGRDGQPEILGVARLIRLRGRPDAEFAILVSDRVQTQGLGTELMARLLDVAREEGIERVMAEILPENAGMLALCRRHGFALEHSPDGRVVQAVLAVRQRAARNRPAATMGSGGSRSTAPDARGRGAHAARGSVRASRQARRGPARP